MSNPNRRTEILEEEVAGLKNRIDKLEEMFALFVQEDENCPICESDPCKEDCEAYEDGFI